MSLRIAIENQVHLFSYPSQSSTPVSSLRSGKSFFRKMESWIRQNLLATNFRTSLAYWACVNSTGTTIPNRPPFFRKLAAWTRNGAQDDDSCGRCTPASLARARAKERLEPLKL